MISVSPDQTLSLKLEAVPHIVTRVFLTFKCHPREGPVLLRRSRHGGKRRNGGALDHEQLLSLFAGGPRLKNKIQLSTF